MRSSVPRSGAIVAAAYGAAFTINASVVAQWPGIAYVDSDGRQWRQMTFTCGANWNQVAALCPTDGTTSCSGVINGQSLSGWVWATRAQVQQLQAELAVAGGCTQGPDVTGEFFQYFQNTSSLENGFFVEGWTSTRARGQDGMVHAYAPRLSFDIEYLTGFTCIDLLAVRTQGDAGRGIWLFRPPCAADLDRDGQVGSADLAMLLNAWGTQGTSGGAAPADLDGSGVVDGQDLALLLTRWGWENC